MKKIFAILFSLFIFASCQNESNSNENFALLSFLNGENNVEKSNAHYLTSPVNSNIKIMLGSRKNAVSLRTISPLGQLDFDKITEDNTSIVFIDNENNKYNFYEDKIYCGTYTIEVSGSYVVESGEAEEIINFSGKVTNIEVTDSGCSPYVVIGLVKSEEGKGSFEYTVEFNSESYENTFGDLELTEENFEVSLTPVNGGSDISGFTVLIDEKSVKFSAEKVPSGYYYLKINVSLNENESHLAVALPDFLVEVADELKTSGSAKDVLLKKNKTYYTKFNESSDCNGNGATPATCRNLNELFESVCKDNSAYKITIYNLDDAVLDIAKLEKINKPIEFYNNYDASKKVATSKYIISQNSEIFFATGDSLTSEIKLSNGYSEAHKVCFDLSTENIGEVKITLKYNEENYILIQDIGTECKAEKISVIDNSETPASFEEKLFFKSSADYTGVLNYAAKENEYKIGRKSTEDGIEYYILKETEVDMTFPTARFAIKAAYGNDDRNWANTSVDSNDYVFMQKYKKNVQLSVETENSNLGFKWFNNGNEINSERVFSFNPTTLDTNGFTCIAYMPDGTPVSSKGLNVNLVEYQPEIPYYDRIEVDSDKLIWRYGDEKKYNTSMTAFCYDKDFNFYTAEIPSTTSNDSGYDDVVYGSDFYLYKYPLTYNQQTKDFKVQINKAEVIYYGTLDFDSDVSAFDVSNNEILYYPIRMCCSGKYLFFIRGDRYFIFGDEAGYYGYDDSIALYYVDLESEQKEIKKITFYNPDPITALAFENDRLYVATACKPLISSTIEIPNDINKECVREAENQNYCYTYTYKVKSYKFDGENLLEENTEIQYTDNDIFAQLMKSGDVYGKDYYPIHDCNGFTATESYVAMENVITDMTIIDGTLYAVRNSLGYVITRLIDNDDHQIDKERGIYFASLLKKELSSDTWKVAVDFDIYWGFNYADESGTAPLPVRILAIKPKEFELVMSDGNGFSRMKDEKGYSARKMNVINLETNEVSFKAGIYGFEFDTLFSDSRLELSHFYSKSTLNNLNSIE